jgi:hypothetical protein
MGVRIQDGGEKMKGKSPVAGFRFAGYRFQVASSQVSGSRFQVGI